METNIEKYIKSFSWRIISNKYAIKIIDRSFVLYGETGIPVQIKDFFSINNLQPCESIQINLLYMNKNYDSVITIDKLGRAKMRFNNSLKKLIKNTLKSNHIESYIAVFLKHKNDYYEIKLYKEVEMVGKTYD